MSCLQRIISEVDSSLQALVDALQEAPSLGMLLLVAWRVSRQLALVLVEEELEHRSAQPTVWPNCEQCGKPLESKGFADRQLTGLIGTVRWHRRVGRCPDGCALGQVAPLDIELGLAPHQRTSVGLKRAACALAVFVPFETASLLLHLLAEVTVSPGSIWNWVQEIGQDAMTQLEHALEALERGEMPAEESMDNTVESLPLLIGADGVMVPFRPEGGQPKGRTRWREVKVAVLARLHRGMSRSGKPNSQLLQRRLVAVLGSIDQLEPRLWLESVRQGLLSAPTVVWLSDGGRGFWRLFEQRFGQYAQGILDFYHLAQNLWKGAKAWLDGRTQASRQWFAQARRKVRHGKAQEVLADLQAALKLEGLPESAHNTLQNLYEYLDAHSEHIDYAQYKALGLPIGSGLVESACKWLIQQRFKGVGMRWSEEGFNHLLHLRLAWVNGRFDDLFGVPLARSPAS